MYSLRIPEVEIEDILVPRFIEGYGRYTCLGLIWVIMLPSMWGSIDLLIHDVYLICVFHDRTNIFGTK